MRNLEQKELSVVSEPICRHIGKERSALLSVVQERRVKLKMEKEETKHVFDFTPENVDVRRNVETFYKRWVFCSMRIRMNRHLAFEEFSKPIYSFSRVDFFHFLDY